MLAVFLGRRELAGVRVGSRIEVMGTAGVHQNRLAILNPELPPARCGAADGVQGWPDRHGRE